MKIVNCRGSKVMQVVQAICLEGEGTPDDVSREVIYYYTLGGVLLAVSDPADRAREDLSRQFQNDG